MPSETLMLMQAPDQGARDELMATFRGRRDGLWPAGWAAHLENLGVQWDASQLPAGATALEVHAAALSSFAHPAPPLGPLLKQGAGESDEAFDARIDATVEGGS